MSDFYDHDHYYVQPFSRLSNSICELIYENIILNEQWTKHTHIHTHEFQYKNTFATPNTVCKNLKTGFSSHFKVRTRSFALSDI